ncbi:hypothetical protein HW49_04385 [Porphyromonadaceae bacterium COT-184 OH4590]|nr:hypothetical protein HW49_04385 [Porphyromonadaceae bacterium COT-184 OH4590]MDO4726812.1 hypothetical protein [Porphyromonadaceae bacterium]
MNQRIKEYLEKPAIQFAVALLAGLIAPILFASVFYTTFYHGDDQMKDVLEFFRVTNILTNLILVSMIPNFIAVFLLNMFDKWHYLRGVFVSIMIYLSLAFLV